MKGREGGGGSDEGEKEGGGSEVDEGSRKGEEGVMRGQGGEG